jgi:hypothetical protein
MLSVPAVNVVVVKPALVEDELVKPAPTLIV